MTQTPEDRHTLYGAGWLSLSRAGSMMLSFIVSIAVARHLGSERFGQMLYAMTWVSMFSALATLGLAQVGLQEIKRRPSAQHDILGTQLWLKACGGLIGLMLAILSAVIFHPQEPEIWILIATAALILPFQAGDACESWLLPQHATQKVAIARLLATLACAFIKLIAIEQHASLQIFVLANAVEMLVASLLLYRGYRQRRSLRTDIPRYCAAEAKTLIYQAWPILVASIFVAIFIRIDQVILRQLSNETELGLYGVAVTVAEAWYFIPVSLLLASLSNLAELKPATVEFEQRISRLLNQTSVISYAITLPLSLAALPIIVLLYGEAYNAAALPLSILAWAGIFAVFSAVQQSYLTLIGHPHLYTYIVALSGILNITLNYLLIPHWQSNGVAVAKLVSYAFGVLGASLLFPQLRNFGKMMVQALLMPHGFMDILRFLRRRMHSAQDK